MFCFLLSNFVVGLLPCKVFITAAEFYEDKAVDVRRKSNIHFVVYKILWCLYNIKFVTLILFISTAVLHYHVTVYSHGVWHWMRQTEYVIRKNEEKKIRRKPDILFQSFCLSALQVTDDHSDPALFSCFGCSSPTLQGNIYYNRWLLWSEPMEHKICTTVVLGDTAWTSHQQ